MSAKALPLLSASDPLADVWRALSDPTRRSILELLREAPRTTGDLAEAFPSSRFAVMKHLDVLVAAGLVVSRRKGRVRWNHLNAVPLQRMYEHWVRPYEAVWARSLIRFKDATERSHQEKHMAALADRVTAGIVTLEMEIPIDAPRSEVWRMLTREVHRWWPRDFYASADPKGMKFDPTLGGKLYEEAADGGGVVWYTVIAVTPGASVDLAGHLTTAFGGPAQTLLRLALRDQGKRTVLELSDAVVGNVGDRTEATLEKGWRALFETGFKKFVEAAVKV
jgi:DNA-binding transcriptional ArsR family regulator